MFRNSQLLQRSSKPKQAESRDEQDWRPVAILADPYEAESELVAPVLSKFGFRVHQVRDGAAALTLAHQQRASLVVASADMPSLSGAQLCQKVREHNGIETPFILISPTGMGPDQFAGHETFASDYARRPLNLEDFETRLSAVLRAHRPDITSTRVALNRTKPEAATPVVPEPPPPPVLPVAEIQPEAVPVAVDVAGIEELLTDAYLVEHDLKREAAEIYKNAFVFMNTAITAAQSKERIALDGGLTLARAIVQSTADDRGLLMLSMDRTSSFSFRQHSVNVAIIGARIAQTLRLPEDRIVRLCLAGIVHDLGNIKLPKKLTGKSGGFTDIEQNEMLRRPVYSADLVTGYPGFEWLPQIVGQIYEREDGTGYPRRLSGKEICEEAKILGIADVLEACIHRRPQRDAMTGYRALEVITLQIQSFDERVAKAMIRSFSVYPFNELVVLNTGEIGKVIDINTENPLRPFVRIVYSVEGDKLLLPRVVDLARNSQIWITKAITPGELPDAGGKPSRKKR